MSAFPASGQERVLTPRQGSETLPLEKNNLQGQALRRKLPTSLNLIAWSAVTLSP
jgi:hypothetical protein